VTPCSSLLTACHGVPHRGGKAQAGADCRAELQRAWLHWAWLHWAWLQRAWLHWAWLQRA